MLFAAVQRHKKKDHPWPGVNLVSSFPPNIHFLHSGRDGALLEFLGNLCATATKSAALSPVSSPFPQVHSTPPGITLSGDDSKDALRTIEPVQVPPDAQGLATAEPSAAGWLKETVSMTSPEAFLILTAPCSVNPVVYFTS
jgi:hypothetical protein